jgi:hypothetical protein
MPNANLFNPSKRYHALHIGPSGSGKTCAGVTVGDTDEKYSRVRILDVDNRFKGIFGLTELAEKIKAGFIEYEQYNANDPNARAAKLSADIETVKKDAAKGAIDTVILSSTTSCTDLYREQARDPQSKIKHNILLGRVMTQVQDYGYIDRAHRDVIVTDLNKLSCNVVIESHLCDDGFTKETSEGDVFIVTGKKINVPGKLSTDLPTWFDETYEFFIDDTIATQPRHMVRFKGKFAKSSFPNLPVELNWTGKNFFKLIHGISLGLLDASGRKK